MVLMVVVAGDFTLSSCGFFFGIFFLQIIRLFICWSHERGGADRLAGPVVDRNLGRRSGRVGDLRVASEEAAGNERRRLGMG